MTAHRHTINQSTRYTNKWSIAVSSKLQIWLNFHHFVDSISNYYSRETNYYLSKLASKGNLHTPMKPRFPPASLPIDAKIMKKSCKNDEKWWKMKKLIDFTREKWWKPGILAKIRKWNGTIWIILGTALQFNWDTSFHCMRASKTLENMLNGISTTVILIGSLYA